MKIDFNDAKNSDRQKLYSILSIPTPDDKEYDSFITYLNRRGDKLKSKKIKQLFKKSIQIQRTQFKNGIDSIMDNSIRYFCNEYNDRLINHGLGSMPLSFNIIESFYKFNSKYNHFELYPEEFSFISFFDFIDYLTSDKDKSEEDRFLKMKDNTIYYYNFINSINDITFETKEKNEFVFAGIAFIKRNNELTFLIIGGEKYNDKMEEHLQLDFESGKGKSYINPSPEFNEELVRLEQDENFCQLLLSFRVDLKSKTIDCRYLFRDIGNRFSLTTDDYGVLMFSFRKNQVDAIPYIEKMQIELENYSPIFEIAYKFIHLPKYYESNLEYLTIEAMPTKLKNEKMIPNVFNKLDGYNP